MAIDVVPHPRIDHLVTGVDGATALRRTEHRGIAWYGGRQAAQTGGTMVIAHQPAGIVSPFWVPDALAYRSDAMDRIAVSVHVGTIYVPDTCALAEVTARLGVNEQQPEACRPFVHLQGTARVPLGISYEVVVLAPVDAVVG